MRTVRKRFRPRVNIAAQLVENYGGTLSLADESSPETDPGGTTFVVRLAIVE